MDTVGETLRLLLLLWLLEQRRRILLSHTHSIHAYTHSLAHGTSCDLSKGAAWFSSPGQIFLFYVHFPFSPIHAVAATLEAGAEENKSLSTLREGHGQSVHRNPPAPTHKDVTPPDPTRRQDNSMQILVNFNNIQFPVWFTMQRNALLLNVFMCRRLRDIY